MTIHTSRRGLALAIPLVLVTALIAGCGGDDSTPAAVAPVVPPVSSGPQACAACSANTLAGLAASGAALANATVVVIDAKGVRKSGSASAAGGFSIDVSGMTAPFILEATGSVGGQAVQLHSIALATDVGMNQVNVTPLTELMSAIILGGVPGSLLNDGTADASKISSSSIASALSSVQAMVLPVLQAAGAASADLRTAEFKPDGTGLDLALDGLQVALVNGAYAVSTSLGSSTTSLAPTQPASSAALTVPDNSATLLSAGTTALSGLQAVMKNLTAQFAGSSLPAASALTPFLSTDFLHQGQAGADFVQKVLLQSGTIDTPSFNLIGATFDQVKVVQVVDASNVKLQYRVAPGVAVRPYSETMLATLSNGQWLLRGDQHQLGATVSVKALLVEAPASLDEMLALGAVLHTDANPAFYTIPVHDGSGAVVAGVGDAWIGFPSDVGFGRQAWIGDEVSANGRVLRNKYSDQLYFAHPDSQVRLEIDFLVANNRVAGKAASVTVNGPGLPAQGLTLLPSPAAAPRDYWAFRNDNSAFVTGTFSDWTCQNLAAFGNPIDNCALDWSKISAGALYTFVALDSAGNVLDTVTANLPVMPAQSPSQILAAKDKLFPQVPPELARKFSLASIYNDVDGPVVKGSTLAVSWTLPATPGMQLKGVGLFVGWPTNATNTTQGSTWEFQPMYGSQTTAATFTSKASNPAEWASLNVVVLDAFGNEYSTQSDPYNHPR